LNIGLECAEPFLAGNAGLLQEAGEKARADVASVLVGNDQGQIATFHLGVSPARERAFEAQFPKPLDKAAA